jgi:nucleoid DNA-binding protein
MVGEIICKYLAKGNKKVIVPGFGTFMRKDSGQVIFVDLLRKDDGLLRELVEDYGHYSEVEAMALIDRFIFEIKRGIERNGSAKIDDFGTMFLDEKGVYQFDSLPMPAFVKEKVVQTSLFGETANDTQSSEKSTVETPQSVVSKEETYRNNPARPVTASERTAASSAKTVSGGQSHPAPRPTTRKRGKSKMDMAMIIAIIAAVIALLIILYGLSASGLPFNE